MKTPRILGGSDGAEWQGLGAAIARGDRLKATEHLDAIVANRPDQRELVERGRFSPAARPTVPTGLNAAWEAVFAFHVAFDHPRNTHPTLQPADRVTARADWIDEETSELLDAKTVVDQADAYLDIIYFALGGLVEIGVRPQALFDIVHIANMAKLQPDGSVKRRDDGKIIKPEGWVAPEPLLAIEVARQAEAVAS